MASNKSRGANGRFSAQPKNSLKQDDKVRGWIDSFRKIEADEKDIRTAAKQDLEFVAGEQWDPKVKADRERDGRPALTFNRLPAFVQKVANEARQNKPQVKFSPRTESEQSKATADVLEGIARWIQYDSQAEVAYETAVEYSSGGSFGFFRFMTEYCNDKSFDLDLKVKPVFDPFQVYGVIIPACLGREPMEVFVVEDVPVSEYRELYPDSDVAKGGFDGGGQNYSGWVGTETIRVAERWAVEQEDGELAEMEDGSVVDADDLSEGMEPKRTRSYKRRKVVFYKFNGVEVLDSTEWIGRRIPIWAVLGKQMIVNGKPKLFSLVRHQLDSQKMINFAKTRTAETLATSPISPFVVAEGQLSGHEHEWATANSTLRAYLTYKPTAIGAGVVGEPKRQTFEPPIGALSAFVAQEIDDMKAESGIFDQSLGAGSTDQSGIAIRNRQQQSDLTNFHFMDNLERAFRESGEELAYCIGKVYDAPRQVKILGPDEQPKVVMVNQDYVDPSTGKPTKHSLNSEDYDVVVSMGRSFSSKRQESYDMVGSLVGGNPDLLQLVGDIMFRNSDVAGADQLAERFKLLLPPQVQQAEGQGQQIPPQAQAAIQQGQAHLQAMNAYAQQLEGQLKQMQMEKQAKVVDNEYKLEIKRLSNDIEVLKALISAKSANQQQEAEMYKTFWTENHRSSHDAGMTAMNNVHQMNMAQQQQDAAAQQQQAAQDQQGQQ